MSVGGNMEFRDAVAIVDPEDISIGSLLEFLDEHKARPLVFSYDGKTVEAGYHVTEVKAGKFEALDCGANPESWTEIFVQLWDVDEDRSRMAADKFSAIVRKVSEHVALDRDAKLTFEVSDGIRPMQLFRAALPEAVGDEVHVQLWPRPASCKPRDRWLVEQQKHAACCGPSATAEQPCCS